MKHRNKKAESPTPRKRVSIIRTIAVKEKTILYGNRRINDAKSAAELGHLLVKDADKEHLIVCCVDSKNQPVSLETVAIGSSNQCVVGVKEVFKNAVLSNASSIFLFHNHPSGDTTPSQEDILITNRIRESGVLLGIHVLDHIILGGEDKYTSMAELQKWSKWVAQL